MKNENNNSNERNRSMLRNNERRNGRRKFNRRDRRMNDFGSKGRPGEFRKPQSGTRRPEQDDYLAALFAYLDSRYEADFQLTDPISLIPYLFANLAAGRQRGNKKAVWQNVDILLRLHVDERLANNDE